MLQFIKIEKIDFVLLNLLSSSSLSSSDFHSGSMVLSPSASSLSSESWIVTVCLEGCEEVNKACEADAGVDACLDAADFKLPITDFFW